MWYRLQPPAIEAATGAHACSRVAPASLAAPAARAASARFAPLTRAPRMAACSRTWLGLGLGQRLGLGLGLRLMLGSG